MPVTQKKRGRPKTGETPGRSVRMPLAMWNILDAWRDKQEGERPTRSEAIRRAVTLMAPIDQAEYNVMLIRATDVISRGCDCDHICGDISGDCGCMDDAKAIIKLVRG